MTSVSWMNVALCALLSVIAVGECGSSTRFDVIGRTGQDVTLPCKYDVKKHKLQPVCWNRGELPQRECNEVLIATNQLSVRDGSRASSRYQLLGRLYEGDVSLTILNVTEADAGRYGCRVRISGWFNDLKQHIDLTVERGSITSTAAQTGSDITDSTSTEPVTTQGQEVRISPPQQKNSPQSFSSNTLRLAVVISIPPFLLAAAHRVWRRGQSLTTDSRMNQPEEEEDSPV